MLKRNECNIFKLRESWLFPYNINMYTTHTQQQDCGILFFISLFLIFLHWTKTTRNHVGYWNWNKFSKKKKKIFNFTYLKELFVQMYFQPMVVADSVMFVMMVVISVADYLIMMAAAVVVVEWIDDWCVYLNGFCMEKKLFF